MTNRKSLMLMSQINLEKEMYENTCKELTAGEKAKEIQALAEKGLEYDKIKEQYIECEGELNILKGKV